MYKIMQYGEVECIGNSLQLMLPSDSYSTINRNLYYVHFPRLFAIRRNFHYNFLNVLIDVPVEIKSARTVNTRQAVTSYHLVRQCDVILTSLNFCFVFFFSM